MSSHSLSLVHPDYTHVSLATVSPLSPPSVAMVDMVPLSPPTPFSMVSPHHPPQVIDIPDSPPHPQPEVIVIPDSPPHLHAHAQPAAVVVRRTRTRRTCSVCRQAGHDARNCPDRAVARGNPRDNLTHLLYSRIVQRVPELSEFPDLLQRVSEEIYFYVFDLSTRQLREYLQDPRRAISYAYQLALAEMDNFERLHAVAGPRAAPRRSILGAEYAKNIEICLQISAEEKMECGICYDNKCSIKTGCSHDFCSGCVVSIINENKYKTKQPICSFCREPITKFTVSTYSAHAEISDFIQNL
jgi:hypothetical protein